MTDILTLGFALHDSARLMRKRFEQRARHVSLTRSQWQVLAMLSTREGIHQKGLADLLKLESVTLGHLLNKMAERGLIDRRRHPSDRRQSLLFLTEQAHPLLELMRDMGQLTRQEAIAGFSQEESELLLHMMERVRSNLIDACCVPIEKETRAEPRLKSSPDQESDITQGLTKGRHIVYRTS
ncbi:MarR family winged helix-turn-helix transcriptional regulator [Pseudomonas sp. GB2N2]